MERKEATLIPPGGYGRKPTNGNGRELLSNEDWQRVAGRLGLSPRELQLVQLIFDGKKLATIARDMSLSLGTVKTYSQRVKRKLAVSDQRELALAVMGAHLDLMRTSVNYEQFGTRKKRTKKGRPTDENKSTLHDRYAWLGLGRGEHPGIGTGRPYIFQW